VVVAVNGEKADARSDFLVVRRTPSGCELLLAGRYEDRLSKSNEGWRFDERRAVALARSDV
jgi:hypothetical protein